ncbi:hypothetical protein MishRS11D_32220 [Methylomagnum ishizawai]|nr:hypothetical protein MishRS11D_32220 [Methylomagnum ishizawai]
MPTAIKRTDPASRPAVRSALCIRALKASNLCASEPVMSKRGFVYNGTMPKVIR